MLGYPKSYRLSPPPSPSPALAPARLTVRVPGSKSITNRALAIAALAEGESTLSGVLDGDDTQVMMQALRNLGVKVEHDKAQRTVTVGGVGGFGFPEKRAELDLANSGTSLRFLAAAVATSAGEYILDGNARMRRRPVGDLLFALERLGVETESLQDAGMPPIRIRSRGLTGGYTFVKGNVSSQFLSGLLMACPRSSGDTEIEVEGTLVSKPYIDITLKVMESFGVRISNRDYRRFKIIPSRYRGRAYAIEPDASAASYFYAIPAVLGGEASVPGLGSSSIQGDMAFLEILEFMGMNVTRDRDSVSVSPGAGPLRGVDVDMNAISDTVMTLGVVALFAVGVTRIRNVAHIRHKETDRIAAMACELRKLGARVDELPDGLVIDPPAVPTPARIETYDDHRMAMAFALAGLRVPGVVIADPGCVSKTYPEFWSDFATTGVGLEPGD